MNKANIMSYIYYQNINISQKPNVEWKTKEHNTVYRMKVLKKMKNHISNKSI